MRMLRTCIDKQVVDELVTKTCLRKHAFNSFPNQLSRSVLKDVLWRGKTLSTRESGVTGVNLVSHLVAFESHLLAVDYDNIVTAVNVRCEAWFVLASEDESNAGSKTAKCQIGSINDDPLFLYSCLVKVN